MPNWRFVRACIASLAYNAQRRLIKVEAINAVRDPKIKTNHIKESTIIRFFLPWDPIKGKICSKRRYSRPILDT